MPSGARPKRLLVDEPPDPPHQRQQRQRQQHAIGVGAAGLQRIDLALFRGRLRQVAVAGRQPLGQVASAWPPGYRLGKHLAQAGQDLQASVVQVGGKNALATQTARTTRR